MVTNQYYKKNFVCLIVGIIILLFLLASSVSAQTYSGFNRFTDDTKLFFSNGDNKVKLALEIREKEVNSALENAENGNTENAVKNLEKAQDKLKIVQEKISLKNSEEVKTSVEEIKEKINKENLPEAFNKYKLEEEKTQLTAELTLKTFEYCKALAQEDYSEMLKQEKCNPETASKGLEKELKELKQIQEESFNEFMLDIRSCIDDPGTCNCDDNTDISQKARCEKVVALAVKCEYKDDKSACDELKSMEPVKGDGFAESFIPNFLMNLFNKKQDMIDYNIEKSDVPEECYNENERVKTECTQYRYSKEIRSKCWDKDGNFLVEECGGPKDDVPTMQESIPQCYDENNQFLTDKCGKVTIVWNEQGLINYLFEGQLNEIIETFENASEQHKIDINGKEGQTMINEVKEEINGLEGQIAERTFAPGTEGIGEPGKDIKNVVVEEGNGGNGTGGLKPEIKTDVNSGSNSGDDGLKPEVKTHVAGDGTEKNDPMPESDVTETHYDPDARATGDTIDETYDDEPANTIDEGTNIIDP